MVSFNLIVFGLLPISILSYSVRRNVLDYGAVGDGFTDDTDAIIKAITEGRADDTNTKYPSAVYSSSTLTPAVVYFPPGTYKVTKTLPLVYYTQLVGDADNIPTIKAVSGESIRVIDSLSEAWGGNLVNQNNFFHQIRNFVIDMTSCSSCTGLHWQVAQATQLQNLHFKMNKNSNSQGIWMENGSGGFVSDLVFDGGMYGMWIGNQQFTSRNITIRDASIAGIYLNWDWGWTFKSLTIENCPVGIDVGSSTGSLLVMDSKFSNMATSAIRTSFVYDSDVNINNIVLENVLLTNSPTKSIVLNGQSTVLSADSTYSDKLVKSWMQGRLWKSSTSTVTTTDLQLMNIAPVRPSSLLDTSAASVLPVSNSFFEKPRPNLDSKLSYSLVNAVIDFGVPNDGISDATVSLQKAIDSCAGMMKNNLPMVLFLPYGKYLITDTLYIPAGSRIFGEAWSTIVVGSGSNNKFSDASKPIPAIQVGKAGESGVAQLVDLLITTKGPQPGAVLVEWNMADPVNAPGSAGMWEVHFRIGGAIGTEIDPFNCPKGIEQGPHDTNQCTGVWALMRLTQNSTAYLENVWGWVADHDLDYDDQINVYNSRGILIESLGPVWMYGTAFEHSLLYQYNLHGAKNVLMAMIQTETPYFQPAITTPFVSTPNRPNRADIMISSDSTDPTFCTDDSRCNMAYGLTVQGGSKDVYLYGAGLYSFFNQWDQNCLQTTPAPNCQLNLNFIDDSSEIYMINFNTYGSENMLTTKESSYATGAKNLNTFCSTATVDVNHYSR